MVKLIPPGSWDWGENSAQLVKVSSQGLVGDDLRQLIKRSSHVFADKVANLEVRPDESLAHLIALGSTEAWGPNRNGDGFKEATCQRYHDTFVKHARAFRHHQNKNPDKSYGVVKLSAYNDAMRRIELLVAYNNTKEAAARNGGLVADRELEKLARGEDLSVSMACTVSHDVCSGCGNRARSRSEYCDGPSCKYGGCKTNLGKVAADGHMLHVDNPHPRWFDISLVARPADRIAWGNGADYLKAASHIGGAAMAEELGVEAPFEFWWDLPDASVDREIYDMAGKCAELESSDLSSAIEQARHASVQVPVDFSLLLGSGQWTQEKFARACSALAEQNVLLPPQEFLRFLLGEKCAEEFWPYVAPRLAGVFTHLAKDAEALGAAVQDNPFTGKPAVAISTKDRQWASKYAQHYGLNPVTIRNRIAENLANGVAPSLVAQPSKIATVDESDRWAKAYAAYQLAFLVDRQTQKQANFPLTARYVVSQNYCWGK